VKWYSRFFDELKTITPIDLKAEEYPGGTFTIAVERDKFPKCGCGDACKECDGCYSVLGKETPDAEEVYGLHFTQWGEWLSFEVAGRSISELGAEVAAAEIIWEMTFCGFTQKKHNDELRGYGVEICGENFDGDGFKIIDGVLWAYNGKGGNVVVPKSVTRISEQAFCRCAALTGIRIHGMVTDIDKCGFDGCENLCSIEVETSNGRYESSGNCLIEKATSTVEFGCKNSVIPDGIKTIGWCAFSGDKDLERITIPDSVTTVEYAAFHYCQSLKSVIIPIGVTHIGSEAFGDCENLTIYARAQRKPRGWDKAWAKSFNKENTPVVWGFKG
jgi:hypothetical protein